MDCKKDKLFSLYSSLNEHDQKTVYEFIKFLAHRDGEKRVEDQDVIELYGKNYYVVPD